MKNIPQAYRPSNLWFWPPLILGGSVISVGTIHDLRRVKVPGTGPLWNPWCIWGLTGIPLARRKCITIVCKIYLRVCFFYICAVACYLEYIWITHNMFCILQHEWRCNMDYSPLWSAFTMKTKNIRITSIQIYEI